MAVRTWLPARRRSRSIGFHRILIPLLPAEGHTQAAEVACRLAADRGATLTAVAVVEVPWELPLDADMREEEERALDLVRAARDDADRYGVTIETRVVRAREAGQAIVETARASASELIVLHAPRRIRRRDPVFAATAASVLAHAPCRVLVTSDPPRR